MPIPTCNGCGQQHYNFKPCSARDEQKARVESRSSASLHVVWRDSPEWRPFGDRLHSYENRGGNLHLLPKRNTDAPEAA